MEAFRRDEEFVQGIATRWEPVADVPSDGGTLLENENLSRALLARVEAGEEAPSFTKEQFVAFETGKVHRGHYIQAGEKVFRPIMGPGLIPIQIKVMDLQRKLAMDVHEQLFADTWNFVDAYLQLLYGSGSLRYQFLRQALLARRALIILDGIDEGGANKDRIQRHVTEVMAAQGHPLLVTSRPAGLSDALYSDFNKLQMKPLTDDQQEMIVRSRLRAIDDEAHVGDFLTYIRESMPIDETTGERITGNPLMLTMVCCIYESHRSVDKMPEHVVKMPEHVVDLYRTASDIMLSHVEKKHRAKGGQPQQLKPLLMRIALATHSSIKRQILAKDVDGLLDLEADEKLQQELRTTWTSVQQQLTEGRIPLLSMLQREPLEFQFSHLSFQEYFTVCAICEGLPLKPEVMPWRWLAWWKNVLRFGGELKNFGPGLIQATGIARSDALVLSARMIPDLSVAAPALVKLIGASKQVREFDIRDDNVQGDTAKHFAEAVLSNLSIDVFSELPLHLLREQEIEELNCKNRNYGPTQMHILASVLDQMLGLKWLSCSEPMHGSEVQNAALAAALQHKVRFSKEEFEAFGVQDISLQSFIKVDSRYFKPAQDGLKRLILWSNPLGPASEQILAAALVNNYSLKFLNLRETQIDGLPIIDALAKKNRTLEHLDMSWNPGVSKRLEQISHMLMRNTALMELMLNGCNLVSISALSEALAANTTLSTLSLAQNKIRDIAELAGGIAANHSLRVLNLSGNELNTASVAAFIEGLRRNSTLNELDLSSNLLTGHVVASLGTTLQCNDCNLQDVNLNSNDLQDCDLGLLFGTSLGTDKVTSSLHKLHMANCRLSDAHGESLAVAIPKLPMLLEVHLGENAFSASTKRAIRATSASSPLHPRILLDDTEDLKYALKSSKWLDIGPSEPTLRAAAEISNESLAAALATGAQTEFTRAELDAFGVGELVPDHFIRVGNAVFTSAPSKPLIAATEVNSTSLLIGSALSSSDFLEALVLDLDGDPARTIFKSKFGLTAFSISVALQKQMASSDGLSHVGIRFIPGVTKPDVMRSLHAAVTAALSSDVETIEAATAAAPPLTLFDVIDDLLLAFVAEHLTAGGICAAICVCTQWNQLRDWDFVWANVCRHVGVRELSQKAYRRRMEAMVGSRQEPDSLVYDDVVLDKDGSAHNNLSRFQWQTMSAKRNDHVDVNAFRTIGGFTAQTDRFVQLEFFLAKFGDEQFIGISRENEKGEGGTALNPVPSSNTRSLSNLKACGSRVLADCDPRSGWIHYDNGRDGYTIGMLQGGGRYYNGARISIRIDFDQDCAIFWRNGEEMHRKHGLPQEPLYFNSGPDTWGDITYMKPVCCRPMHSHHSDMRQQCDD